MYDDPFATYEVSVKVTECRIVDNGELGPYELTSSEEMPLMEEVSLFDLCDFFEMLCGEQQEVHRTVKERSRKMVEQLKKYMDKMIGS